MGQYPSHLLFIPIIYLLPVYDHIGCGLSTLEVAANLYISVLGSPRHAAARLSFSQGFQGIASFSGPLIASRWFFLGANATKLETVQWVYLAVAGLGIVLNVLF